MRETKAQNKGITLIALVITIIVMLILVGVTISMAVNGGLFEYAGKAAKQTNDAMKAEGQIADGGIEVDGEWYNSLQEYADQYKSNVDNEVVEPENDTCTACSGTGKKPIILYCYNCEDEQKVEETFLGYYCENCSSEWYSSSGLHVDEDGDSCGEPFAETTVYILECGHSDYFPGGNMGSRSFRRGGYL